MKRLKKMLLITTASLLMLFTVAVPASGTAEAKGGARGGSPSISKPSAPIKSTSSPKTSKAEKPVVNDTKSNHGKIETVRTSSPTTAQINRFKYKPRYNTSHAAPPTTTNVYKYENKSYYSKDSGGFTTALATSIGTFLVLDAILDDGTPVYIDSDTGEQIDLDDLDELTISEADAPEPIEDNGAFWEVTTFLFVLGLFTLLILLVLALL